MPPVSSHWRTRSWKRRAAGPQLGLRVATLGAQPGDQREQLGTHVRRRRTAPPGAPALPARRCSLRGKGECRLPIGTPWKIDASSPRSARLDLVPVGVDLVGVGDRDLAEHVRMTAYELVHDARGDVVDAEVLGHLGVEHHLHQDVAEFLAQRLQVTALDRVDDLVRLLQEVGPEGGVRLLAVPGALAAQGLHDRDEVEHARAGQVVRAREHLDLRRVVRADDDLSDAAHQLLVAVGAGQPDEGARRRQAYERGGVRLGDRDLDPRVAEVRDLRVAVRAGQHAIRRTQGVPGAPGQLAGRDARRGREEDQASHLTSLGEPPVPESGMDSCGQTGPSDMFFSSNVPYRGFTSMPSFLLARA